MSTAREIHVGTPADDFDFSLGDSVIVHFHDFESLTSVRGEAVSSPTFNCAGYEWCLEVYSGGNIRANDGMVSVFLCNKSSVKVHANFEIAVIMSSGRIYAKSYGDYMFGATVDVDETWGWKHFAKRDVILDGSSNNILNKGTLAFLLRILPNKGNCWLVKFNQQSTLNKNIFKLFGDETIADVAFEVSGSIFYGHKQVIKAQAPELFQLADQFDMDTPMPISGVDFKIFEIMLKHVYGGQIHCSVWKEHSKQILEASGKYGFSALKIEAEAWHAHHVNLTVDTAVDELLYADGTHCLDLKKVVMEYIAENGKAVLASPSFPKLAESTELMTEVMMQLAESNESKKRKLNELSQPS